jgi:hypothetical protein
MNTTAGEIKPLLSAFHRRRIPARKAVKLTGLTKQDYITRRLLCKDVVVQGNPRVYKALRDQLAAVLDELRRIEAGQKIDNDLMDTIDMIAVIMNGMKEESE